MSLRPFNPRYRCYPVSMLPGNERQDVERGGKVIMPPSALEYLTRLNVDFPMLFKLTNPRTYRITHCGVLEFVAGAGRIYLPSWMMCNLLLEESGLLQVECSTLPVATFSKFQPQSEDFLDITNAKAVLENALRNFACLTTGDIIAIEYNNKIYELRVLETRPGRAVSIIECDMNVEFEPPVGYKEPQFQPLEVPEIHHPNDRFLVFGGQGKRLDGKQKGTDVDATLRPLDPPPRRGIPDYDYKVGTLQFMRGLVAHSVSEEDDGSKKFSPFSGRGRTL